MRKSSVILVACISVYVFCTITALASESNGTILAGDHVTKICKSTDCSSYGNVNWKPTLNANTNGASPIVISGSSVTGYAWGDEIGWINMQPTGYGVSVDPNTGSLSGYAWSNAGSWINFSPTTVSGGTPVGVRVDSQGQFYGWAYVSGIDGGWMDFDCSSSSTCIKTDWRPVPYRISLSNTSAQNRPTSIIGTSRSLQAYNLSQIWAFNQVQYVPTALPIIAPTSSITTYGNETVGISNTVVVHSKPDKLNRAIFVKNSSSTDTASSAVSTNKQNEKQYDASNQKHDSRNSGGFFYTIGTFVNSLVSHTLDFFKSIIF